MTRSADRLPQRILYLASSFIIGAVFLCTLLTCRDNPELGQALGLLLLWIVLSVTEPAISHRFPRYFTICLTLQTAPVFVLLVLFPLADFFALLLSILSMHVMSRLDSKMGGLWLGLCTLILALWFARTFGSQAVAFVLVYTAANVFLGLYALATRRAQAAWLLFYASTSWKADFLRACQFPWK